MDRLHQIEEELRAHRKEFNELKQKGIGQPDNLLEIEPAFDAAGQPSHRKSSVASTQLLDNDDDEPTTMAGRGFQMATLSSGWMKL